MYNITEYSDSELVLQVVNDETLNRQKERIENELDNYINITDKRPIITNYINELKEIFIFTDEQEGEFIENIENL